MKVDLGICSLCSCEFGDVVKFKTYNSEVDLCPRCVKEMYLLLKPIELISELKQECIRIDKTIKQEVIDDLEKQLNIARKIQDSENIVGDYLDAIEIISNLQTEEK